jgi:DNA-binding CsgD family transcriptional regulator
MAPTTQAPSECPHRTSGFDVIAKRAPFRIVLLDDSYRIVAAEPGDKAGLFASLGLHESGRSLPSPIQSVVREAIESLRDNPAHHTVISLPGGAVVRLSILAGTGTPLFALCIEPLRSREELNGAKKRFGLTAREVEVLGLVLDGFTAGRIADQLSIAETTVGDYFKGLLKKTRAVNRADMVARVLDWSGTSRMPRAAAR